MIMDYIVRHRKHFPFQRIEKLCRKYLGFYGNLNYEMAENGEGALLQALGKLELSEVFDVGANVGDWALLAAQALPKAQINCFEILPETASLLKEKTSAQPRIHVNAFGLSDANGKISVRRYQGNNTLTTMIDYPHEAPHEVVEVQVITGDEYLDKNKITKVDFLKIDAEGSEELVLKGFRKALEAKQIQMIQFEYGQANIITHFLLRDFYEWLGGLGYSIGKIYPNGTDFKDYAFADEDFLGPNYLAVLKERTDLIEAASRF